IAIHVIAGIGHGKSLSPVYCVGYVAEGARHAPSVCKPRRRSAVAGAVVGTLRGVLAAAILVLLAARGLAHVVAAALLRVAFLVLVLLLVLVGVLLSLVGRHGRSF